MLDVYKRQVTDRQGDILMGTEGGMLVFSPDSIVKQTYEAPIVVTGIKYSEDNLSLIHILEILNEDKTPAGVQTLEEVEAALSYPPNNAISVSYTHLCVYVGSSFRLLGNLSACPYCSCYGNRRES